MKKTLTVLTLLAAGTSQAAGLAIDTQSARSTGMGSTGVASSRDASSIFYNPAGILGINKLDAQLRPNRRLQRTRFAPRDRWHFRNRFHADCFLALDCAPLKRESLGGP